MSVNTEKDDLKRAIAKLGGIQLDGNGKQAANLWGAMARDAHADRPRTTRATFPPSGQANTV